LVTNSILSFTGASGSYSSGNVTLDGSTTTYRPGSGSNPDYINASPFWDGTGNDFNSQTYGASKGYYVAEGDLILDSEDSSGISISGNWSSSTGASGYHGNHYLHDGDSGQGSKSVRYTPTLPASGFYEVLANWTEHSNRASNAPINITHKNGTDYLSVNQRSNGGQWVSLGIYGFNSGSSGNVLIHNTGANGYVVADAVKFVAIPAAEVTLDSEDSSGITFTGTWLSSTSKEGYQGSHYMHDNDSNNYKSVLYTPEIPVSGSYEVFANWTADTNRASTVPIDISHDGGIDYVSVNQQSNGGQWVSLGTYDFAAGTSGTILIHNTGSNGYVIADGLKLVQQP